MPASMPLRATPPTVTALPLATFLSAKLPLPPLPLTLSVPSTPDSTMLPDSRATVVPSYTRSSALRPVTRKVAGVMLALSPVSGCTV